MSLEVFPYAYYWFVRIASFAFFWGVGADLSVFNCIVRELYIFKDIV